MKRVLLLLLGLVTTAVVHSQPSPYFYPLHLPDGSTIPLTSRIEQKNSTNGHTLSSGSLWLPMGAGLTGGGLYAARLNGDLYVLQTTPQSRDLRYQISKWNGASWDSVTSFTTCCQAYSFGAYKGELYVGGYFESVNGIPGTAGLARWDGTSWRSAGGGISLGSGVFAMTEYKGELHVAGAFSGVGGINNTSGIARWNGSRWASLGNGISSVGGEKPYLQALAVYRGKLYLGGNFAQAGLGGGPRNLAAWNGQEWEVLPEEPNREVEVMAVYNDELYVHGPYITTCGTVPTPQIARWNGRQWKPVGTHGQWLNIRSMTTHDGQLYACGTGGDNVGIVSWNGSVWSELGSFDNIPFFVIEHDGSLVAGGYFMQFAGAATPLTRVARMCSSDECGTVAGSVYIDKNNDCKRTMADSGLERRMVMIEPGPFYVATDPKGRFTQKVLPGSYTLRLLPKQHWIQTCPQGPGTRSVALASAGEQSTDNDFASRPIPNIEDVGVSITASRIRPGRPADYIITYENTGTVPVSGSLTFTYDQRISYAGGSPAPNGTGPLSLTWNFSDLVVDESRTIRVTMNVPPTLRVNEELCAYVHVETGHTPNHFAYLDDHDSICIDVTNAYDPNDITVHPYERDDSGLGPADTVLAYIVRFQNTGNDTAFKVVVTDTLSSHLDPATLRLGAASHPYTFTMNGNGILTWTFDDIMLPDSGASEPNSHGTFKYFVRLRHHLPAGTKIPNRAAIYFDYNAAVVTNTVISTIATVLGVENGAEGRATLLTPNPSSGVVQINAPLRYGTEIVVTDLLGTVMMRQKVEGSSNEAIDLAGLPTGTYFVALPLEQGTVMKMVRLVR